MSKDNGVKPEFDFSRVPRVWRKKWLATVTEATELQMATQVDDELDKEQVAALAKAMRRISEISEEQQCLIAQVVVFVPASLIHPGAPPELDWADPASYDWLTDTGYQQLIREMQTERRETPKK